MLKYGLIILISALYISGLNAQSFTLVKEVSGFENPESAVSDGTDIYVSNLGKDLKPSQRDGDGYISRLKKDGTVLEMKYITGLNAPKGMVFIGKNLYVADVDKVLGFELATKKKIFELPINDRVLFLNDIVVRDNTTLYVSGTDVNKIYEIKLGATPTYKALALANITPGPNGLWFDRPSSKLYVVGMGADNKSNGRFGCVNLAGATPTYEELSTTNGVYDGVCLSGGELYFTNWVTMGQNVGVLQSFNLTSKQTTNLVTEKFGGPADFSVAGTGELFLPRMTENKVSIYKKK